jgi:hypothetical protein
MPGDFPRRKNAEYILPNKSALPFAHLFCCQLASCHLAQLKRPIEAKQRHCHSLKSFSSLFINEHISSL